MFPDGRSESRFGGTSGLREKCPENSDWPTGEVPIPSGSRFPIPSGSRFGGTRDTGRNSADGMPGQVKDVPVWVIKSNRPTHRKEVKKHEYS